MSKFEHELEHDEFPTLLEWLIVILGTLCFVSSVYLLAELLWIKLFA